MQLVPILAWSEWVLTGQRRYRASERMSGYRKREGIVLLQVEEHRRVRLANGSQDTERRWRDATPDDLLQSIKPD